MRFGLGALAAAILGMGAASPAYAKAEPVVLEPNGRWLLDFAEDKCSLSRVFGEGENRIEFLLEQAGKEPYFTLAIFGAPARASQRDTMRIRFGPSEAMSERSFLSGRTGDEKTPFVLMHGIHLAAPGKDAKQGEFEVVDIGPARETAITTVSFERGVRRPLTLALGSMGKPLKAMRTCIADLMEEFGPLEDEASLSKQPELTNPHKVGRYLQERYPSRMLKNDQGGTVKVRLTVDRKGEVSGCQITKSARPAAFDDLVCFGLMRIAVFEPAVGPDGEPRLGVYQTQVTYKLN